MNQHTTKPRFTFPPETAKSQADSPTGKLSIAGLDQWIQQHPQMAFIGAVFLGASLAWLLKTRK